MSFRGIFAAAQSFKSGLRYIFECRHCFFIKDIHLRQLLRENRSGFFLGSGSTHAVLQFRLNFPQHII